MIRSWMKSLARILDIGADPSDGPDLRVRKRVAVGAVYVFMTYAIVYFAFLVVANLAVTRAGTAVVAFAQIAAFTAALVVFRRTGRLEPLVAAMVVVGEGALLLQLIPAGGFGEAGTSLVWVLLVPLGAVLLIGARAALPALASVLLVLLAAIALDPYMRGALPLPGTTRLLVGAANIFATTAIALGMVLYIDGERVRARAESEALLVNILPRPVADRLKKGERVIADHYDAVTVLFADLVDFTPLAAREPPAAVVEMLNGIFDRFDTLVEQHELEKIKTIGDAYMVVAGAPEARPDHAAVMVELALAMHAAIASGGPSPSRAIQMRTGIASGPVVAGVIGHRKFSYDVWGSAVNFASRMETSGVAGMIQVHESTWRLCHDLYRFTPREVDVKGIGTIRTYVLDPASAAL
jgi:adenylate cyclase